MGDEYYSSKASDWVEELDPDSGYPFYLNTVTGESTWARPPVLDLVQSYAVEEGANEMYVEGEQQTAEPYYNYEEEHLEASETYGYGEMGGEVDEYGNFVHVQEESHDHAGDNNLSSSNNKLVKKQKKKSWVALFKENALRPWQCALCSRPNRANNPACVQCGKKRPERPTLENVAARKIQAMVKTHFAWKRLRKMIENNYEKLWDGKNRVYYYKNKKTGEMLWEKPVILQIYGGGDDDIALSPRSQKLKEEREFRELGMREREEKFQIQRRQEKEAAEEEDRKEWEACWALSLSEAKRTGELLNCWKGLPRMHTDIFTLSNLTSVRLIGHKLTYVPPDFCKTLLKLQSLSFSNNLLTELPHDIGNLTGLTDLNLLKNKITHLPESLCVLTKLSHLDLCNNKLKYLPEHFGALSSLSGVLTIEVNDLTELPDSIGDLNIEALRVSRNLMTQLPTTINRLKNLCSLVVNGNNLEVFPAEVCDLVNIRHLSLCRNKLVDISPNIGNLVNIENLWLDWNKIRVLPDSVANCKKLKYLKLEGNPMVQPTFDIISEGTGRIRLWCENRLKFAKNRQRVRIVSDLQHMFGCIEVLGLEDEIADMVTINPAPPHDEDGYYAFCLDRFFPSKRYENPAFPRIQKLVNDAARIRSHRIRDFDFTIEDVKDALESISDPLGPIGHSELKLNFKKCSCQHKDGRRKVCIPPSRGWLCRRRGCLIKKRIMSEQDYRKQIAKANDAVKLKRQISLASSTAWRFIRSAQGMKAMLNLALSMAQDRRESDRVERFVAKRMKKAIEHDKKQRKRRERRLKTLEDRKVRNLNQLTKRREKLLHKKESLRGWELEECNEEIDAILEKLERSPEDEEIARIGEDNADADQELEDAKVAATKAAGFKELTEAQKKRPDAALLQLAHSMMHEATNKYVTDQVAIAKEKCKRESALMAHIYGRWQRSDMKIIFEAWRDVALEMIEIREYLEERLEEDNAHNILTAELQQMLVGMEQAKWTEHYDEFNDKPYYIHSETGEQKDFIPDDEAYVPRTLRDDRKRNIKPSVFQKFLRKQEHHDHLYPKGMEEMMDGVSPEYFQMVDENADEAAAYLEDRYYEYEYDQQYPQT